MAMAFRYEARRPPSASACRAPLRRAVIFGVVSILFAAMAYIAATYGIGAIVRCEIETNGALGQARGAMSEIASSNACGF